MLWNLEFLTLVSWTQMSSVQHTQVGLAFLVLAVLAKSKLILCCMIRSMTTLYGSCDVGSATDVKTAWQTNPTMCFLYKRNFMSDICILTNTKWGGKNELKSKKSNSIYVNRCGHIVVALWTVQPIEVCDCEGLRRTSQYRPTSLQNTHMLTHKG